MALNPNIIANAMSNITAGMPDASNLMAQRVQGMENIYKLERQREADAQVAAEAQAEELTAALSPAIAAAFSDPTDAGLNAALSMVPEQYRSAAQAQLDQLRGIGDINQRKNIMRAALVQDEVGQRLLAQLEPTANMRLQADTAANAQALQRRRLAMEEQQAGQPKVAFRETDAEGNVRMYDAAGNEIGMLPKAGKPAPAPAAGAGSSEQKMQAREGVDGTLSRIKEQYDILKAEKEIVSSEATTPENIRARIQTKLGPIVGRTVGTKAQTARDTIANLRQALLADIKAATGMSSKAIDSNVELKSFLDSLGDPDQSIETIQNTLAELSIKYGMGGLSAESAEVPTDVGGVPQITSDEEFDALPPGAEFIDPEGVRRRKP